MADDAWLYWATATTWEEPYELGGLWKQRKEGGERIQLAVWDWYESALLALDATHVYWMPVVFPGIFRVSKQGGEVEQLMEGDRDLSLMPRSLIVDDRCVYFTVLDSQKAGGAVFKIAK